jgi:putative hemolysin
MTLLSWAIILLLIAVNALFVAAEFAAVGARRVRIQQRAEAGSRTAARILHVLQDTKRLDRYIATCQVGITISSLVLGAFGQITLSRALAPLLQGVGGMQEIAAYSTAAVVVLVGLTMMQMVLGELVPKSVALQYPTQTAQSTVLPVLWTQGVLSWFIDVLNGSGLLVLRALGFRDAGPRHIHSPEEIELLIAESRDGGLLEPDEHRRLRKALQLSIRTVNDVMVPRTQIVGLNVESGSAEVLRLAIESPYTRLPVYEETIDNIIGLVHVRDVALRALAPGGVFSLRAILRPMLIVPRSMTAERLLARMREERRQLAVVSDEFGGTAGLVTIDDVLGELLGDVADEFKAAATIPEVLPDGRIRLPGHVRLDEAAQFIGREWSGASHTVSGRVMEELGRVPQDGERLVIEGVPVEVVQVKRRHVELIIATPIKADDGGQP